MSSFRDCFDQYKYKLDIINTATNNFADNNYIAEGGFGKVYRGEFLDSKRLTIGAVKRLDRSKEQADISFWREIMLLTSHKHENIISLLGFCNEGEERIIVYEYASNKSLDFHLDKSNLTWIKRLKICLGAARGLACLHDPKGTQQRVLHRDIKSANILLDENWNAKIADFGLSKHGPANQQYTFVFSNPVGTLGYCDPNYIEKNELTKESDVYSFGVVLFEVLCSRPCVDLSCKDVRKNLAELVKSYHENNIDEIIDFKLKQQMEQNSRDTFVKLAYQCLEKDSSRRPPMALVVKMLASALKHQEDFEAKGQETKRRNIVLRNIILKELHNPLLDFQKVCPPGGSDSLILYTTRDNTNQQSFKDCLRIRFLLKDFNILYQERDVSIHWDYKEELWRMLGRQVALPILFIKGRYIGGAEEVLQLHEQGKFQPLLAEIPSSS
ncbi:receptor-like protein kinase HERK 1 [Lactuca sativa]|uniref:receptor-like protein kinase HERK 1 n=1 Tax=Lactuca sativa TaxID=4236 RepID=UPI000CC12F60|nr:receptor-like protein kinase HERK 1 [Lactuca sativa]